MVQQVKTLLYLSLLEISGSAIEIGTSELLSLFSAAVTVSPLYSLEGTRPC